MTFRGVELFLCDKLSEADKVRTYIKGLKLFPKEYLVTKKSEGRIRYYSKTKDGTERYLRKSETDVIRKLEQKEYCLKLALAVEKEIRSLKQIIATLHKIPVWEQVFAKMPEGRRHLIKPYACGISKDEIERWKNDKILINNASAGADFATVNGVRVRSKSELIIADRLEANHIPFQYEHPIFIDNNLWQPDFFVLNKRTGREYYWEHFGMMDNADYCEKTFYKLEKYASNDIIQGINLIVTAETSKHPLSTMYVDTVIEKFLL